MTQIQKFLMMYRNTPHSTTLQAPAKLLLGRNIRTQFDALIPSSVDVVNGRQTAQIKHHGKRQHELKIGDTVVVRDYRNNDQKRSKGTVTKSLSKNVIEVDTEEGIWKRHLDQTLAINSVGSAGDTLDRNALSENVGVVSENEPTEMPTTSPTPVRPVRDRRQPDRYTSKDFKK
ncbi:uncharacterized protein LOC132938952 [Metopolophium dirhodum]|uniref:uncharacterized protein LOC132938952 n=1 Tax=Metopolophium dirhodum TaxID=44670 RepID=UPI00298F5783|nr:uncharacterized protein LOC132938952 [Metopolophium dirhodum]